MENAAGYQTQAQAEGQIRNIFADARYNNNNNSRSASRAGSCVSSEGGRSYDSRESVRYGKYYEKDSGVLRRVDINLDQLDLLEEPPAQKKELEIPNKYNIHLNEIAVPKLTPEEHLLPGPQKRIRVLLKKCQSVKCFNFLSIDQLIAALEEPTAVHSAMVEELAVFQSGEGAHEFYLTWSSEADKLELLNHWLTQQIWDEEVADLDPTTLSGNLVSAFSATDGLYYRAEVVKVDEQTEMVQAFLVDTGKTISTAVDKLKGMPMELISIPAFAFKCRLAEIDYSIDPQLDYLSRKDFCSIVRGQGPLKCAIQGRAQPPARNWEVYLKKGLPPVEMNTFIRKQYYDRKRFMSSPAFSMQEREELSTTLGDYVYGVNAAAGPTIEEHGKIELKGLRSFRVTHVENPFHFYVQYAMDQEHGIGVMSLDALQIFYNSIRNDEYKLCTPRALIHRCYAWKDAETGLWERVRVIETNGTTRSCRIYLVDIGQTCEVGYDSLRELAPKFINVCARGLRAHLVDIKPLNTGTNAESKWSEEASAALKKFAIGKTFHGIIVERKRLGTLKNKSPFETFSLGLVMVDKNAAVKHCLNAVLCLMGLAEACGVSSGFVSLGVTEANCDLDEMRNGVEHCPPEGMFGVAAAAIVTPPHNPAPKFAIDKNKSHSENQNEETTRIGFYYETFQHRASKMAELLNRLPVAIRLRFGTCHMTHVLGPSCFYLQMVDQIPDLKIMTQYLAQKIADYPTLSEEEITDGLLVAVNLMDELGQPSWHRAIVKHAIFSIKLVKVVLVDFGNEVSVKYSTVRNLPEYFWNIPGYAQRVHLDVKNLRPYGSGETLGWSTDATEAFRKYLSVWEPELPVYYVWKRHGASNVLLDEYNQEVVHNAVTDVWEMGPPSRATHEKNMKRGNDTAIGQNLFTSIGVDVVYEVQTEPNESYGFEKICTILITKGLATLAEDEKEGKED